MPSVHHLVRIEQVPNVAESDVAKGSFVASHSTRMIDQKSQR